ncbi:SPOC domain-like protein [Serendipita vermifera]|nr:SPOC domain-like protein [Serendipita vermifera]
MPPKRAGYTVTMFVVDVSRSMGKVREVEIPTEPGKPARRGQITNLEWALRFVMLKVQELIFHNRKTDMCGIVLTGSDETRNAINDERPDEYFGIVEYIGIGHPTPDTLAKIAQLKPSAETDGDALAGLIVALNAQNRYLASKPSWSRKLIVVTDGENAIDTTDYKATIEAMNDNNVQTSIVGIDFDDPEFGFVEENKSDTKKLVEKFWRDKFVGRLNDGIFATCEYALQECARPDVKEVKSTLGATMLRFGDPDEHPDQSINITVRTSKATAIARPPPLKKFGKIDPSKGDNAMQWSDENGLRPSQFAPLKHRTDLFIKEEPEEESKDDNSKAIERASAVKVELDEDGEPVGGALVTQPNEGTMRPVPDDSTQRAYKYGATYIPIDKADFEQLKTEKGLDILGFIPQRKFRRDWAMGEVYYIWGDTESARNQIAFSSIVQALAQEDLCAVIRMVTGNNYAPKLGVAVPRVMDKTDCLLWVQMPFAEDHRNYTFQSFDRLFNKHGNQIKDSPYQPTDDMMNAMEAYVDSMDLMQLEKDDEGKRYPWFDTLYSYNPALHRVKQALFHAAVSQSLSTNPLPPPHPELTKYFEMPKKVIKRSREPLEECKKLFKVKHIPPRIMAKKEVLLVEDREDEPLLLGPAPALPKPSAPQLLESKESGVDMNVDEDQETEDDDESKQGMDITGPYVHIKDSPSKADVPLMETNETMKDEFDEEDIKPSALVGLDTPLEDFKAALASGGDVVSEAVAQLSDVIKQLAVAKHFPNRRKSELLEAMKFLRETCLMEDEIVAWNEFIRELKQACLSTTEPGNKPFWEAVKKLGNAMTLIGKSEATKAGASAKYAVKNEAALQFFND